jgi:hypothetical protein
MPEAAGCLRQAAGALPPVLDRAGFERFFNCMKNWRGLASRYNKHDIVYRGGVVVTAILDWLT